MTGGKDMKGVRIENIQPWQIFQQENGYATVKVYGAYERRVTPDMVEDYLEQEKLYISVCRESDGEPVIWWTECEADGKNWSATLEIPAGGPYSIYTCMKEKETSDWSEWASPGDMVRHIGVGDLYLIAGQSNAVGYGKDFIEDAPELGVHMQCNNGDWDIASHPLSTRDTCHDLPTDGTHVTGHSMYLSFAKALKRDLGYPIGLIPAALGGVALSRWNPEENGDLYEFAMQRIGACGGKIKGILWYQGCSDTGSVAVAYSYSQRFETMVKHFRKDLGAEVPVFTMQIAYANDYRYLANNDWWGVVRQQQADCAKKIPGVYVLPTTDSMMSDMVHIAAASNVRLGQLLAKQVLTVLYGKRYMCHAPALSGIRRISEDTVELAFDNVYERLETLVPAWDLEIVAQEGAEQLPVAEYQILDRNKLRLTFSKPLSDGVRFHAGFPVVRKGFLPFDYATHMPLLSFYDQPIDQ